MSEMIGHMARISSQLNQLLQHVERGPLHRRTVLYNRLLQQHFIAAAAAQMQCCTNALSGGHRLPLNLVELLHWAHRVVDRPVIIAPWCLSRHIT